MRKEDYQVISKFCYNSHVSTRESNSHVVKEWRMLSRAAAIKSGRLGHPEDVFGMFGERSTRDTNA